MFAIHRHNILKSFRLHSLWSVVAVQALICVVSAEEKIVVHDPAVHAGSGLKKELTAGIGEADFLRLGDKPQMVKITLVTAFNETNSWLNFNGYSHGRASYTIPKGWTVEVTLINPSPAPHSAVVVERDKWRNVRVGDPAFRGACTPNPDVGISSSKATFSFTASEAGEYAICCGVPTHASGGHWAGLYVIAGAIVPTLKLGDSPPREAK